MLVHQQLGSVLVRPFLQSPLPNSKPYPYRALSTIRCGKKLQTMPPAICFSPFQVDIAQEVQEDEDNPCTSPVWYNFWKWRKLHLKNTTSYKFELKLCWVILSLISCSTSFWSCLDVFSYIRCPFCASSWPCILRPSKHLLSRDLTINNFASMAWHHGRSKFQRSS